MAVAPTLSVSTQVSISVNFSSNLAPGTVIKVSDEDGEEIMEFTNEKTCKNLVYSSSKLELNKTYMVSAGEDSIKYNNCSNDNVKRWIWRWQRRKMVENTKEGRIFLCDFLLYSIINIHKGS